MTRATPISLWDASAVEPDVESPLTGDLTVDVAIVGAGFTGLSTALHAAEKDIECHVLEAEQIGFGGSGRNVGLVNAGLWLPPQDVRKALGEKRGSAFVDLFGNAPAYVFSLIEKHQIRCEATKTGTIHAAHAPKGYENLARRAEEWHRLGAPVDLLSKDAVTEKTGSHVFYGGLMDRRCGTINPMGYVRGLARAAQGAGAKISTGVKVEVLERDGEKWRLQTNQGVVRANKVVLGTNAYTDELWPGLRNTFTMIHYLQFATEPLGGRIKSILPEGQGLWDTAPIMFSLRRDQFGRLQVGTMGRVLGGKGGVSERWAGKALKRVYPDLGPVEFEEAWHGQIAMTPDHLMRIYRLADNLYTPIGYNGRGITTGTMFGKAIAELLAGGAEADLPLPVTAPKSVSAGLIKSKLYDMAFSANQFMKSF